MTHVWTLEPAFDNVQAVFSSSISLTPVVSSDSSAVSGNAALPGGAVAPDVADARSLAFSATTGQRPPLPLPLGLKKRPHDVVVRGGGLEAEGPSTAGDPLRPSMLMRVPAAGKTCGQAGAQGTLGITTPLVEQEGHTDDQPQSGTQPPLDENVLGSNACPAVAVMLPHKRARSSSSFLRFASPTTINVASALSLLSKAVVHTNAQ